MTRKIKEVKVDLLRVKDDIDNALKCLEEIILEGLAQKSTKEWFKINEEKTEKIWLHISNARSMLDSVWFFDRPASGDKSQDEK